MGWQEALAPLSAANTGLILVQPVAIATDSLQTQQKATAYVRGAGGGPYDQGTNVEIKKGAEDLKNASTKNRTRDL